MITSTNLKNIAGQIATLFCESNVNKTVCIASVKQRIIADFNDSTFNYFLSNIQYGRFYMLKLSNWKQMSDCRKMGITATYTDVITGEVKSVSWYYTNSDCGAKQYWYPDLNYLIRQNGNELLDAPISSKNNSDITKERLVYKKSAQSYNIVYVPNTGGGGGTVVPTPTPTPTPTPGPGPVPNAPVGSNLIPGVDLENIFSNPIVWLGVGVLVYWKLIKK